MGDHDARTPAGLHPPAERRSCPDARARMEWTPSSVPCTQQRGPRAVSDLTRLHTSGSNPRWVRKCLEGSRRGEQNPGVWEGSQALFQEKFRIVNTATGRAAAPQLIVGADTRHPETQARAVGLVMRLSNPQQRTDSCRSVHPPL